MPPTADLLYNSPISRSPSLLYPSPSLATTPLSAVPELGLATFQDPPPRASREKANETISYLFAQDSEVDAEGESDDGGSEDEYVPSPRPALRDRAVYNYAYCSRSPSNSSSTSSGYSPRPSPSTRPRPTAPIPRDNRLKRTRPRHAQLATPLDPEKLRNFTCEVCGYVQRNQRKPDFKRHLQTHTRSLEKDKWVCCGVPEEYTGTSNIIKPIMYEGRMMVGGCFKVFSRRDALKRHLDNKNTSCIGALAGYWMSESR